MDCSHRAFSGVLLLLLVALTQILSGCGSGDGGSVQKPLELTNVSADSTDNLTGSNLSVSQTALKVDNVRVDKSPVRVCNWTCYAYRTGENSQWCATNPIVNGFEYKLTKGDGTCGSCWCCRRCVNGLPPTTTSSSSQTRVTATVGSTSTSSTRTSTTSTIPPVLLNISQPTLVATKCPWRCHSRQVGEGSAWCSSNSKANGLEYSQNASCGCACCCRVVNQTATATLTNSSLIPTGLFPGASNLTFRSSWMCHNYLTGQNSTWCKSNPIVNGYEYKFVGGDGTCGPCACCKRQALMQLRFSLAGLVMYELFIRSFTPSGTFKEAQGRVDELVALGVNLVWLMPIFPIGIVKRISSMGSPYSVRNFTGVNPDMGTLDDLVALVSAFRARGVMVMLDWVSGHSSWDNPWITQHPDWYSQVNGTMISNKNFNWADTADFNYPNAGLQAAMISALTYWIQVAGFDGFRMDYVAGAQQAFWRDAIAALRSLNRPLLILAEGYGDWVYDVGFDISYDWDGYDALVQALQGGSARSLAAMYLCDPWRDLRMHFSTNNDKAPTPVAFGSLAGANCAQAIVTFFTGVPLVFNGQEVGSSQKLSLFSTVPIDWSTNPSTRGWFRRLLCARKSEPALLYGQATFWDFDSVLVANRTYQSSQALLVANIRNFSQVMDLSYVVAAPAPAPTLVDLFTGARVNASWSLGPNDVALFVSPTSSCFI